MAKYQKQRDSENQISRWSRSNGRSFREKDSLDHVSSVPLSQGFLAARLRKKFSTEDNNRTIKFTTTPTTYVPHLGFDLQGLSGSYSHRCLSLRLACCRCLPNSRDHYINKEYYGAGLHDVLKVNASLVKGLWYWLCPVLGWTMQMTLPGPLVSPKDLTFSSPRVQEGIERSAELRVKGITFNSPIKLNSSSPVEHDVAVREETERAKRILDIMCSSINVMLLRLTNYTMMWVLGKLFRHFYIQRSHIEMLKEAQTRDVPMVFLPCHKSHVDYILMTFALLNIGIKVPHIAAGDNLNIPIFNLLIHRLGGYFIRRKIDIGQTRDELYRDCLQEYIEQLLKANQNIEIYIEGSRSRSGKPSLAKSGLMSFLVDAVRDGTVSDVLIVPVGVSYDRIVERNFVRHELMGGNKRQENLFRALGGVWRMLSSDIGSVRVDFAQPFSLQEYLNSFHISSHSLLDFSHPSSSLLNNSTPNLSTPDRRIITALSQHIVYDFTNASSIMCTNIVGFLLLTKYRQGAKISHLIDSYRWVADRVTTSGRALGYSDSPSEAVHYALCYLKSLVYYKDFHVSNQTYKVVYPKLVTPDVFQLLHHSNQVNTLFIKESIIGNVKIIIITVEVIFANYSDLSWHQLLKCYKIDKHKK
jgi:glycerol-3-phosphate O-acyltransferase 1/2